MRSARLQNAAAANAIARECLKVADQHRREALAELDEIGDLLAAKSARAIDLMDAIYQLNEDTRAAAEIICRTNEAARQHAEVAIAKQAIAAFVAERKSERAA